MNLIAKILIFFSTFISMSRDLMWGNWLDTQEKILGSPEIPKLLIKYIPIAAIGIFLISFIVDIISNKRSNRKLILTIRQRFLDRLHKDIFQSNSPNQDDFNRITFFTVKPKWIIFRRQGFEFRFYNPWSDYLIITSRTGKFQKSLTSFKIDGDKKVENNGIAGKSWHQSAKIIREVNLNPSEIQKYCEKTNIAENDFKKLNQQSKFFTAFCVLNSYGNKIGVLVIDTINTHKIDTNAFFSISKSLSTIHED
jgi:hypothetical protein